MGGIIIIIAFMAMVLFGPPILFTSIAVTQRKRNKDTAKTMYILAVVWLIIGGGICASMWMG